MGGAHKVGARPIKDSEHTETIYACQIGAISRENN